MADNKGKHTVDGGGGPTALPDDEIRMTVKDIPIYVSEDVKNLFDGLEVKNVKMNCEGKTNECDVLISGSNEKASDAIKKLKETKPLMAGKTMKVSFSKDESKIDGSGAAANSGEQIDFSHGSEVEIEGIPERTPNSEIQNQLLSIVEEDLEKKPSVQVNTYGQRDNRRARVKFNVPLTPEVTAKLKNADLKGALQGAKITAVRNIQEVVKLSYNIRDDAEGYIKFINELRKSVVNRDKRGVVDDIFENGSAAHPVLAEQATTDNPPQWIEITMGPAERYWTNPLLSDKNMLEITLAVRKDNLYIVGFKNKNGWFQLEGTDHKLPEYYNAKLLSDWFVDYGGLMKFVNSDQLKSTLKFIRLGKDFAVRAVRRLSCYDPDGVENNDDNPTRLGLMGLTMMISEAARMNPILDTIAGGWNGGAGLTSRQLDIIWDWKNMSAALLLWKESHYKKWPQERKDSPGLALASIHLVLNSKNLRGSGRTWVEILSVSANFQSIGTTITVFDEENQACNIYEIKRKQREQCKLFYKKNRISDEDDKKQQDDLLALPTHEFEVHVEGISTDAYEDLKERCKSSVGEVSEVLMRGTYAFVYFKTNELASKAIAELDKTDLKGKEIRVSRSKNKLFILSGTKYIKSIWNVIFLKRDPGCRESLEHWEGNSLVILEYRNQAYAEYKAKYWSNEIDFDNDIISFEDPRIEGKGVKRLEPKPGRCISGYESFGIGVTTRDYLGVPITGKFKWACRKQEGCVIELVSRRLILDPMRKIDVTYLVMSDALKATVEVKLRPKGGSEKYGKKQEKKYTVQGEISARIGNFEDEGQIMLFSSAQGESIQRMTNLLKRPDVMVPRDNLLHIDMRDLVITDDSGEEVDNIKYHSLSFNFGTSSPPAKFNGSEVVQVGVKWASQGEKMTEGPEARVATLLFFQHDHFGYTNLINNVRRELAEANPSREKVLDGDKDVLLDTFSHLVLTKPDEEQASWIHIWVLDKESWSALAIRRDDLSVGGFINQCEVWYSLTGRDGSKMLGTEYNFVPLGWPWGSSYQDLLDVSNSEAAVKKLDFMRPGKEILMDALRVLSRYPDVEDGEDPRVALVHLMIIFCWSACLEPLLEYFENCWDTWPEEEFSERLMDYIDNWHVMSETLLRWKKTGKWSPTDVDQPKLKWIEINNEEDALKVLRLVYNKSEEHGEEYTAPNLEPSTPASPPQVEWTFDDIPETSGAVAGFSDDDGDDHDGGDDDDDEEYTKDDDE
ncbi:hypothetical protein ACP70R_003961 [Stipagrostis hirtigluma subsp. patula]